MEPSYSAVYGTLYGSHWWWRAREHFLLHYINSIQSLPEGSRVLDIGCGDGAFLSQLSSRFSVDGIEPGITGATDEKNIFRGSVFDFPAPNPYTLVLLLDVLEHIEDRNAFLGRVGSLLEPHGLLLITVPSFQCLWTRHDELNHHQLRYTKQSLKRELATAGFEIIDMRYLFFLLFFAKFLLGIGEHFIKTVPRPPQVPPKVVNSVLSQVMRLDLSVGSALPLPVGSTLLALCRPKL